MHTIGLQMIGNRQSAEGTQTFRAWAPAKQQWLPQPFHEATPAEVDQAVALAAKAFPAYKKATATARAAFLHAIASGIEALGEALLQTASEESGLPLARLNGERDRTANQLRLFAKTIEEGSWVHARIDGGAPDIRQMQIPLGPVAVFGASNFPLAFSVAGGDTAAALAAGCPVVCKAHPAHPHTSHLVAKTILEAAKETGMPEGVFSLVHGATVETGQHLARHPQLRAIAFTGSFGGGKALFETAAQRPVPIPVYAEMGSVNPIFLLPGMLAENAATFAAQYLQSLTMGVGQFCTNPGVIVTAGDGNELIKALETGITQLAAGVMLTPGILNAYQAGLQRLESMGALPVCKGADVAGKAAPVMMRTSLNKVLETPGMLHEVFGPAGLLVLCDDAAGLSIFAEALEGQLTASIHGTPADLDHHAPLADILREKAGRLLVNGFPTGVAVNHAMVHGGPWPAATPGAGTSVGTASIYRFTRPVCFQDFPGQMLPEELRNENPRSIWRMVNGDWQRGSIS
ncbi:aldehyde dehydrogenase (NADP(+)) [Chitinophaga sp. NPDC101104]|uniref:aldehyde dehydrogenase (NADP(+)) n=1 Tax=Chitinophaga sp. NPDC101104 TaxID=3390561 RepID=UPI003CFF56D5